MGLSVGDKISRTSRLEENFSMASNILFVRRGVTKDSWRTGKSDFAIFSTSSSFNGQLLRSMFSQCSASLLSRQRRMALRGIIQRISLLLYWTSSNNLRGRQMCFFTPTADNYQRFTFLLASNQSNEFKWQKILSFSKPHLFPDYILKIPF